MWKKVVLNIVANILPKPMGDETLLESFYQLATSSIDGFRDECQS
jgi:hypothetical protein